MVSPPRSRIDRALRVARSRQRALGRALEGPGRERDVLVQIAKSAGAAVVEVPLLPILFFAAPGLWRNICPLAASNQTPRVLKFTRAGTPPEWLRRRGYLVAITLFFGITVVRMPRATMYAGQSDSATAD